MLVMDVLSVLLAEMLAFLTMKPDVRFSAGFAIWMGVNMAAAIALLFLAQGYAIVFSLASLFDAFKIVLVLVLQTVLNVIFAAVTKQSIVSVSAVLVFGIFLANFAVYSRFCKRLNNTVGVIFRRSFKGKKRVMIVGGGEAALLLVKEQCVSDRAKYRAVCILDDDKNKIGKHILNVKIVGNIASAPQMAKKYNVDEIFFAIPSATRQRQKEIINILKECKKPVKILPGIYELADGKVTVSKFRDVEITDLLGREQVQVDLNQILGYIENKTVLVTGGGGSIGSELCRQIATHHPKRLIVLDIYENNAYAIEQELKRKYHDNLNLLTLIASVRDIGKMRDVFEKYRPQIVFHAAAHKHVPLMETSPNEAVKNNVFGTLNVARLADEFAVETFVQISTDKAVNPTNVMGCTKRICEMIIQTIGKHSAHTKFVAVRFGNVLGSNGSVIPLFKQQIAEGGPVTVTDKNIIRYFMTIPEAVSLVIQAGAYAKGGQIFVLDMGEPVKIYDLARHLIQLSGYEPDVDIPIVCTGLRPGEKLYEERLMAEEGLQKTENGLINIAKPIDLDENKLWHTLDKLYAEAYAETENMKKYLADLVPTYTYRDGQDDESDVKEAEKRAGHAGSVAESVLENAAKNIAEEASVADAATAVFP